MQGGLGAGAMAIASRCCGKKDYGELKKTMVNTLFAAYALTLIYVITAFIFRDRLLIYFGARGETLELSKYIFTTCLISVLNDSGLWIFFAVLRASGQIKRHFYLLVVSILLNTILEPTLIFGWAGFPKLGLMGAPMARFISYFTTTFVMISILTNTSSVLRIDWKKARLDWKFLVQYIKISVPAMIQGLLSNFASLVMLKIAAPSGDALLATLGIGSRLDVFVMMIGWAIGGSTSVLVGHNLGAGDVKGRRIRWLRA
jgi:Na+-driven multidrug efflux pump